MRQIPNTPITATHQHNHPTPPNHPPTEKNFTKVTSSETNIVYKLLRQLPNFPITATPTHPTPPTPPTEKMKNISYK